MRTFVASVVALATVTSLSNSAAAQLSGLPQRTETSILGAVRPTVGAVGDTLGVAADFSAFSAYSAEDVLCIGAAPVGQQSAFVARAESFTSTLLQARISAAHTFAAPQNLTAVFGDGSVVALPPLGPVSYPGGVRRWRAPLGAPTFTSNNAFACQAQVVDEPCTDPPLTIHARWSLVNGCLRAKLPGPGAMSGDALGVKMLFATNTQNVYFDVDASSIPDGLEFDWDIASSFLTFPIATALAGSGCTVTYDPATNELVICPTGSTTITAVRALSAVEIELDESKHVEYVAHMGAESELAPFGAPGPNTAPRADFFNFIDATYNPLGYFRYDDDTSCDRYFVESSDPAQLGSLALDGPIRSAVVEIYMRGFECQTNTDGVWFGWNGGNGPLWSIALPALEPLSYQWNVGDQARLCFDLDALPLTGGGLRSILDGIYQRDGVDVVVQDDTEVEHVRIKVLRYQP